MKALLWIKDHWYLPVLAVVAFLGWWLTRGTTKKGPPLGQIQAELKAIDAGRQARELSAKLGAEKATQEVRKVHAESVAKLDADQAKKADELKADPVALSRFLVKAGSKRP